MEELRISIDYNHDPNAGLKQCPSKKVRQVVKLYKNNLRDFREAVRQFNFVCYGIAHVDERQGKTSI